MSLKVYVTAFSTFLKSETNQTVSSRIQHLKDLFEPTPEWTVCKFSGRYYAKHFAITIERYYNVAMPFTSSLLRALPFPKAIRAEMRTGHPPVTG